MKNKSVGSFIECAASVLALVALVIYLVAGGAGNIKVIALLAVSVVCGAVYFFIDHPSVDVLSLVAVIVTTFALCIYIIANIASFLDYFNGITMFGTSGSIGTIVTVIIFITLSTITHIVANFMKRKAA